jgi:hypothetical protein
LQRLISNDKTNIPAGNTDFKTKLARQTCHMFDPRQQAKVIKIVDVRGESVFFNQAIELAAECKIHPGKKTDQQLL